MSSRIVLTVFLAAGAAAWSSRHRAPVPRANACGDSASVSVDPPAPRPGSIFRVRVSGTADSATIDGDVAGEPLHFTPRHPGSDTLESLAAIPIVGSDSVRVEVRCIFDERSDTLVLRFTPARATYPIERLRVAPTFGTPPDSALAARIEREAARALEVGRGSHRTPPLWTGAFARPRASRITSGFGRGREYNGTITSRHMGTDFAGAPGAPVRAVNRGVVRIVDAYFYGGNVIYIDHGAGLTSAYLHLSAQLVAAGDTVDRGQTIGRVGATGRVTGPHLHLIVRYGGVTVDPLSLFAVTADSAAKP